MRAKKVIAGILFTVLFLENSLTSLASPAAGTEVVVATENTTEESSSEQEILSESVVEESISTEEVSGEERSSEEEDTVSAEETTEEEGSQEESEESSFEVVDTEESVLEDTSEETVEVTTVEETLETMAINENMAETAAETEDGLDYILGRPMTEAEIAAQEALVPDYLPQLELMPMNGMSDIDAGLNQISLFSTSSLPSVYDSRDKDIITSVKDQNPWGTCWSFATMALMESSWLQQFNETIDLSERHLAYFMKHTGYDPLGNASDDTIVSYDESFYLESGGNLYKSAAKMMNWHGAAQESDYPYSNSETVPAAIAAENAQDIIAYPENVFFIPTSEATQEEKVTTVKELIQKYGCVEWSYYHHSNFYNASTAAFYLNTSAYGTNHSITVVGWDDTYSKNNFRSDMQPENDGAWIVKNSWGTSFGDEGYIYISYEDKSLGAGNPVAVIVAGDAQDYDNNYFYGNIVSNSQISPRQSIANVYTINGDTNNQKIKAVSFMAAQENMSYSIQLYKNPDTTDGVVINPASGEALLEEEVTGTVGYTGLYTAEIPEITVAQEDKISVVVTFDSAGWVYCTSSATTTSNGEVVLTETNVTSAGESFGNRTTAANGWVDGADSGYSYLINLLTENVSETVTTPTLTYTLGAPADFTDTIDCNLKWVKCSNALSYELYRAEGTNGTFEKIADVSATNRTYQDAISLADKGKTFCYKLTAVYENDVREESAAIVVDTSSVQLQPETDFKQYMDFVLLEWGEMAGAEGYILEKKTAAETTYTQLADVKADAALSYEDKEVADFYENVYDYRIRAYTADGVYSDWKEWSTTDTLSLSKYGSNRIRVKWKKVNDSAYFRLKMGIYIWPMGNYSSVIIDNMNEIGDVNKYYMEMYASQEAYLNGELPLFVTPDIYYYTVPDTLTGLSASWDGEAASFTWDATTTADTIAVYRSRTADDMGDTVHAKVEGTATSYMDTSIDGIGMYYYWFVPQATNSSGEIVCGEASATQVEVTVEPVDLLSVTEKTESSVEITWKKHNLADGYSVYRKAEADSEYEKIASISDPEQVSYLDETVTIGKVYDYKVVVVVEDGESGLDSAEAMQVQTRPAAPVLVKSYMTSVEIKNNPDLEYAAVMEGTDASGQEYVSGTEETLVLTGLSENTSYEIYARTKTPVTGTASVYSEALAVTTQAIDTITIELEKTVFIKNETANIQATIAAGEETEEYTGDIAWSAVASDSQDCSVLMQGDVSIITGADGKEILRIEDRSLTATALSEVKEVTLTGTMITTSGTELSDTVLVEISVPLEKLALKVESVNGIAADSLEGMDIGDLAVLVVEKEPFNTDETVLQWQSQDETVAVITPDSEDENRAQLEVKGLGITTITVQNAAGTIKDELEVSVTLEPVVMISAVEKDAGSIAVSWEKNTAAEGYKLYRKDGSRGTYTFLTEIRDADQISYEDTSITTGKTYYYKVTAVCDGVESDLSATKEMSARTSPAKITVAENGITSEAVTINSVIGLEYAIGASASDKTTLTYIKATEDTLTFNGLEPNSTYVIYVRTDSALTNEAAVYGPALNISTMIKAELILSIKDVVLSKGNKLPFSYTITPDNLHYPDALAWSAADVGGQAYEVVTMGTDTVVIKGSDGNEICRVSNGYFYAVGDSSDKDVYVTVKRGSLEADFHAKIHVPVTDLQLNVVSVNGDLAVTSLENFCIGQKAQLELSVLPINAEETILWSSSNEKVVSVNVAETDDTMAEITANGMGSCVITAASSDGVKTSMTVTVNKVAPLYGIWISDMADLSGALVEKDPVTGEYISQNLEKQPVYELNDTTVNSMTIVSYVLEDENGGAVRKAEEADGIIFRSSDPAVVSVTPDGTITAAGSGKADVLAYESKGNGIYGSCHVIVTMQEAEAPKADGYPLDKKIKLSSLTKNLYLEAFSLDEKSSCEVQIKDQYGNIYSSEEEKQLFTFTSADPSICMVDEMGVVRPNPTYDGRTASVKITAALKEDLAKRKVVFTVKLLTEKQIDRIALECILASEDAVITEADVAEVFAKGKTLTFEAKAYDSKGNVIENPKLKFTMSDTKVAKVKDNKDGTVTVTLNKAGRSNLVVTGNDVWKKTMSVQITAADTKPYLSKTTITMNTKLASKDVDGYLWKASEDISIQMPDGAALQSLMITGVSVGKKQLSETELLNLAWMEKEDGSYYIAAKEAYVKTLGKNAKLSITVKAEIESELLEQGVAEEFKLTVKLTSKEPKITVSEAKSINRFYTDKNETLLILKAPSIITEAEVLDSEYFTVTELKRGQWYLKFTDPDGTYNAKKTKLTLRLTAEGYEPVEKKLTVQTPYKAPALKQQAVPVLHLGNDKLKQTEIVLYDNTNKVELSGYEITSFTSTKLDEGNVSASSFFVSLKEGAGFKNNEKAVAQISVQKEEWAAPVALKVSVKISTKTPKIKMSAAKITLNAQAAAENVTTALASDQKNVEICSRENWNLQMYDTGTKEWVPVTAEVGNDWLVVSYDVSAQQMIIGMQPDHIPDAGSYKFRLSNVLEGFEEVYKDFTVKVVDVKPAVTVTVKGKQDLIDRASGSLTGTFKFKNTIASKAADVVILSEDGMEANSVFVAKLLPDGRFTIRLTEEGMKDASLKKQKLTLPVAVTMENGTLVYGMIRFSLTQANPKVKVPAMQTIYKSTSGLTKEYDFAGGLAEGVALDNIDVISVPKGFTAAYKDGSVIVTLNDRGIKAGIYQIKVKLYFEGAAEGTKPVSKTVKVKVTE